MVTLVSGSESRSFVRNIKPEEIEYLEKFHAENRDIYDARVGDSVRGKSNSRVMSGVITKIEFDMITVQTDRELIIEDRDKLKLV